MKKIIGILSLLVCSNACFAEPFSGIYAGYEMGLVSKTVTTTVQENSLGSGGSGAGNFLNFFNNTNKQTIQNVLYGFLFGYGWRTPRYYFGIDSEIRNDGTNQTNNFNLTASDGSSWGFKSNYRRGIAFGIGPRIGIILENTWLLYGKVAVEFSRDYAKYQQNGGNIASPPGSPVVNYPTSPYFQSPATTKTIVVPGIGLEKAFGQFSLLAEYDYVQGPKISQNVSYLQTGGGTTFVKQDAVTTQYQNNMFKLAGVYRFG